MSRLLDRVREALSARHYSILTGEAYLRRSRQYILFFARTHPSQLRAGEVGAFASHLASGRQVAASTQSQALSALLFLYREVLGLPVEWVDEVERARQPRKLPVVFIGEEVGAVLNRMRGEAWLMASLLYVSGLRLVECVRLRVKDVDFARLRVIVREGKGGKDCVTVLPQPAVGPLRRQMERAKALHEADMREGFRRVYLPYAPARKYPRAGREWAWQYVFPASKRSVDPGGSD